jgi:aspartate-semialdehyde dehydrogenase
VERCTAHRAGALFRAAQEGERDVEEAMSAPYTFAVFGATGAVGRRMVQVLSERSLPVASLRAFASARSAGTRLRFRGGEVVVEPLTEDVVSGAPFDYALLALPSSVSRAVAPRLAERGVVVIDNSSAFRLAEGVPLVIPEVNADDLASHANIIANPNCSTIGMLVAIAPLHRRWMVKRVVVATYQSVSGKGQAGIAELDAQERGAGAEARVFARRIHHNVVPLVDVLQSDYFTAEEHKMIAETRKMLHQPSLGVMPTCVRVPVPIGHSEAIVAEFAKVSSVDEAVRILSNAPGVRVAASDAVHTVPVAEDCAGQDDVIVGRIRRDPSHPNALALWCVSDNLRKGAATNAVQIAECLIAREVVT